MSLVSFLSPTTKVDANEVNATYRPSALMGDAVLAPKQQPAPTPPQEVPASCGYVCAKAAFADPNIKVAPSKKENVNLNGDMLNNLRIMMTAKSIFSLPRCCDAQRFAPKDQRAAACATAPNPTLSIATR
jgi:hypothetical protein